MPGHYSEIKAQLVADLSGALGAGAKVSFGRLIKPKGAGRFAVVLTSVERVPRGRQVQETYTFLIGLMIPVPPTDDGDAEDSLMSIADELIGRLAPFALDEPDTPAGSYAGVASLRRVVSVKPMEMEDAATHVGVWMPFSCMATVYQ